MGESKLRFDQPDDVNLGPSHVVVHVVIRGLQTARNRSNPRCPTSRIDLKTLEWTRLPRFRDREAPGSIPGPRPILSSKSPISDAVATREVTAVSQIFLELGRDRPRSSGLRTVD